MRTALYEAANVILTRPVKSSDLKGWALAAERRDGPRKRVLQAGGGIAVPAQGQPTLLLIRERRPGGLIVGDDQTGFRTSTAIGPPQQGPFVGTMDGLGRNAISSTR